MKHYLFFLLLCCACPASLLFGFDLETAWLERNPKDYNPMEQLGANDRPQPGETNWWLLHVYNNSRATSTAYTVSWRINHMPAGTQNMLPLAPGFLAVSSNRWIVPDDYTYDFSLPLTNIISAWISAPDDTRTNNNDLAVYMDALTFHIAVYTGTFYHYTVPDSTSVYENLQYLFARLNHKLAEAVYPLSPFGILDRCRIDTIDFTTNRRLSAEIPHPNYSLKAYFSEPDQGGHPGGFINYPHYFVGWFWYPNTMFSDSSMNAFIHECGHCLQAPDIYNFDLQGKYNFVNPGTFVPCTWMDPPGKIDIMRSPYHGTNSVFTEYEAIAINLQPGIQRPVTPEMLGKGPGNTNFGYMYRDLPKNVNLRLFAADGTELDGAPVKIYRGFLHQVGGYPDLCFTNIPFFAATYAGGITFVPAFTRHESFESKMSNCFQVAVYGGAKRFFHMLDFPRFNYMYWHGYTNTVGFAFTNDYTVSAITDVHIRNANPHSDTTALTLDIAVSNTPRCMKISASPDALAHTPWRPFYTPISWQLPSEPGRHSVFVQVLSQDFVPSIPVSVNVEYAPGQND